MAISERDLLNLTIDSKIKPLSFQNKTLSTPNASFSNIPENKIISKPKAPSFFYDPKKITELRREHERTKKSNDPSAKLVSVGLHILDNMICLQNPSNLDPTYMNNLALAFFKQAARAKNPMGTYLEGLSNIYGFGKAINVSQGLKQIQEAAKRKCAEAQHFLALCFFAKANFVIGCMMERDAAYGGHPKALRNYKKVMRAVWQQIARARRALNREQKIQRRRMLRRKREHYYQQHRHVMTH